MINVDTSILNDPAFRAAGWNPGVSEIKRTYSPPIPTAGTGEYFQAPPGSAGLSAPGEDEDDAGMVTGGGAAADTIAPSLPGKRRRRKEQLEEDDSSDLSDESNDEAEASSRPANQIRFAKMPVRTRAGSSPARTRSGSSPVRSTGHQDGPSLFVTSPSRPPDSQRLRGDSLGALESVRTRGRRDTATSSDVSSEGDLDPSVFRRKKVNTTVAQRAGRMLGDKIKEEEDGEDKASTDGGSTQGDVTQDEGANDLDSDDASLSSGFSEAVDANSLLEEVGLGPVKPGPPSNVSPRKNKQAQHTLQDFSLIHTPNKSGVSPNASPRKNKQAQNTLQELPPPRPISTVQPVSALAAAIKAKNQKGTNPIDRFAAFCGKSDGSPLYIKIYVPETSRAEEPLELFVRKTSNANYPTIVADAIGYSLWRYGEEKTEPKLQPKTMNVNRWTLRMIEDGEVDFDFPALTRTNPISDFTSNNNRPHRGRARDKPWDEFALVEANEAQFRENKQHTPSYGEEPAAETAATPAQSSSSSGKAEAGEMPKSAPPKPPQQAPSIRAPQNPITASKLALRGFRQDNRSSVNSKSPADMPATVEPHATPKAGPPRNLNIHYHDADARPHIMPIEVTTDTYIAEVFDEVCRCLNVDRGMYVLRVTGTSTVAPTDRTVEALGPSHSSLVLVRRRFIGEGAYGLSGSPGSTSPNAPLLLTTAGTAGQGGATTGKKSGKKAGAGAAQHPLAQADNLGLAALTAPGGAGVYKRYNVVRKQPMSFTPSHTRVLVLDGEYLHIMPGDSAGHGQGGAESKTRTAHFSSVIGCKVARKHPRMVRISIFRDRGETKRYDLEAVSEGEAVEIAREIDRGVRPYRDAAVSRW